jgi:antitoxin HigA-1
MSVMKAETKSSLPRGKVKRLRTHPGAVLKEDFMTPLNLSANALALALGVQPNRITGIINGERGVSADSALRLARYFGGTAEWWLRLQDAYDLSRAEIESKVALAAIKPRKYA